jgi:DNA topoisomerase I
MSEAAAGSSRRGSCSTGSQMLLDSAVVQGDPIAAASAAALRHISGEEAGFRRVRRGKSFSYVDARGRAVRDRATLARIRSLAIPPAWTEVWISPDPDGHIQATGRDARGRKQYRYHAKWREVRDEAKYHRLVGFCRALPSLREAVERDLSCACLCKRKVVATVVALMERAQLRVGNDEYARQNRSYGATTLRDRHAKIHGDTLELAYRGKGGIERRIRMTDRRLARIVRSCRDLPGQRLFQYVDGDAIRPITSSDVNDYIREITGGPFTAKDYRTWAATLGAALLLCALERPANARACKRCVKEVLCAVAERLGHTPTICKKSYVHPRILDDFASDRLGPALARHIRRRLRACGGGSPEAELERLVQRFEVDALRAIEPVVARYLDPAAQRRRA